MADLTVSDLASVGLVLDRPGHVLPPEAWTTAENVRIDDDGVAKGPGWTSVLDTTGNGIPYYVQSVRTVNQLSWYIYADLTKVYAWDQTSVAEITRAAGVYATVNGRDWNGCSFAGIPILTNGVDPPQYWTALSLASDLADLTDWTADLGANSSCRIIRSLGPYLVAVRPMIAGVAHPHGVLWSHPADPGTLPASWDITDPTKDAGLVELSDSEAGQLVDALPLRSELMLYKESAIWRMRIVGGDLIMQFDPFLISSGILAPHCVAATGDGRAHFVATQDDLIIHDGSTTKSILDKKLRTTIFSRIDTAGYLNSFVFAHPSKHEMWFAYPESGSTVPTRAVVWNYGDGGTAGANICYEQEFDARSAAIGDIETTSDTWATTSGTWATDSNPWNIANRRQVVIADPVAKSLAQVDSPTGGGLRNGLSFTGTLQRTGLAFSGRRRTGEPIVDHTSRKFIRRLWIKASGAPIKVRVGATNLVNGSVTWSSYKTFNPATQIYLDFLINGREAPAVEFKFDDNLVSKLFGYTLEIEPLGRF